MRICLLYDCLFPWTVGGGERWYRDLAERLAGDGHEVTYVTLRQWERGAEPEIAGVRVLCAGPRMELYTAGGRRRIVPPLRFGAGVLWHLLRRGRSYDAVHTASFPYFSLLAAGVARPLHRYRLIVDWFEVWSAEYWRGYLGRAGPIGWGIQALCARIPQRAFCFSRLHAERLRRAGLRGEPTILRGAYAGSLQAHDPLPADPLVLFAGRHIPEKRTAALVPAVVRAAQRIPGLRGLILGDGPEREHVLGEIARLGAPVTAPGFVSAAEVSAQLARALCMLLPSSREGYGQIVVEAAALGVPSILVRAPDNAAVELIEQGVNGLVVDSLDELGEAIVRVHEAGPALRASTAAWFAANAARLSIDASLQTVLAAYARS